MLRPVTVLVLACVTGAQQSRSASKPSDEIAALLASKEPRDVAWGARHARDAGPTPFVPQLLAAQRRLHAAADDDARHCAGLCVIDALLVTSATPSREDLAPWIEWKGARLAVLALLAREPRRNEALFAAVFAGGDPGKYGRDWLLAGSVLACLQPKGFARQVLRGLDLRLQATVSDASDVVDGLGGGGRRGLFACSMHEFNVPERYPPQPCLMLADPERDLPEPRLRIGDTRLCLERTAYTGPLPTPYSGAIESRDRALLRWIEELTARQSSLRQGIGRHLFVRWTDAAALDTKVGAARDVITAAWERALVELQAAGALSAADAETLARTRGDVRIELADERKDKSVRLPDF